MNYRPEVDGLRAIAIVSVVLYHAHVPGFGGGYVGVDVFFVISGYLIIGLLSREFQRTGDLSLLGFFERRIRRLAPALVVVLVATLILGAFFLTPINGEQQGLAKSAIATVLLVSNLYFARHTGGYFDGPAEAQPLLHTWSLSVEEQFYLFWPLVVLVAGRYALRRAQPPMRIISAALLVLFAASFSLSLWWTRSEPHGAFFGAPARAWEFAAGGLMFFALQRPPALARYGGLLAAAGLVAIGLAATLFTNEMAFPGYLALLPVLGTAAVIAGCAQSPHSLITRWLSLGPVVGIGLVSYGWYLWHWPLISIARVHTLGEIGPFGIAALCGLSLLLAAATYRYVELPIRHKRALLMATRRRTFSAGAIGVLGIVVAAGVLGSYAKLIWSREGENIALSRSLGEMSKVRLACWQSRPYAGSLLEHPECDLPVGNGLPHILVWGDSHASHLVPVLSALAAEHQTAVRVRFMPECPPLQDYSPTLIGVDRSPGCEEFNRDVLDEIASLRSSGLTAVIIAAHWSGYLQNPEAAGAADFGLRATLAELQTLGVNTLIAAPVPDFPHEVPACLARRETVACGVSRQAVEQQRASAMTLLDGAASSLSHVRIVDPISTLCNASFCAPMRDAVVLFRDAHHLSEAGSMTLLPLYAPYLAWSLDRSSKTPAQ